MKINFDTYCFPRKDPTPNECSLFLEEVDNHCPVCGAPLIRQKGQRCQKFYEIAHVFPNSPTDTEKEVLKDVEVAGLNSEDFKNKIALCQACHKEYDDNKTVESYENMYRLKQGCSESLTAKKIIESTDIESELVLIISRLAKLKADEFLSMRKLELSALTISEKMEDEYRILRNKIEHNVTDYYLFIKEEFRHMDSNSISFETIALHVKYLYSSLKDNKIGKGKIFDSITEWFEVKTRCRKEVCEIMVAFFIQDCEIYEKLPK